MAPMMMPMSGGLFPGMNGPWTASQFAGWTFPQQFGGDMRAGGMQNGTWGQAAMQGMATNDNNNNAFANQQRSTLGQKPPNSEESAYFRQPVNPHRHQGRRNIPRPADYREI